MESKNKTIRNVSWIVFNYLRISRDKYYHIIMDEERTGKLREIKDEIVNLKDSPLYEERVRDRVFPVIGEGNHDAKIMFVGEAPGKNEAETGRPFCGAAGRVLDELLAHINLPRKEVYVTNIVKDRPPENRDPLPEEILIYGPFLDRQVSIIQPKVIATLGRFSMKYIMERYGLGLAVQSISKIHGHKFETEVSYGKLVIVPLYHPATALYTPSIKEELKRDFEVLGKLVREK